MYIDAVRRKEAEGVKGFEPAVILKSNRLEDTQKGLVIENITHKDYVIEQFMKTKTKKLVPQ